MSEKPFRPLLACETPDDLEILTFPLLASYKIDGIRAIVRNGVLVSRTMKPIPSAFAQEMFAVPYLENVDGELLAVKPVGPTIYHDTYSAAMTHGSNEPLVFNVFDCVGDKLYKERRDELWARIVEYYNDAGLYQPHLTILEQRIINNVNELLRMEQESLDAGFEGLVMRSINGKYKQGRSTLKEGILVKLARTMNSEAYCLGYEEMMTNENPATESALGFTKRSSHQENLRPTGMMGAMLVKDVNTGVHFKIGTGFDHSLRKEIWDHGDLYIGRIVKYKFKPYGTKDLPRQPSFIGWRSPIDM